MSDSPKFEPYEHPSGGWGSLKAVATYVLREGKPVAVVNALMHQNKPGGFACVSCAWAKPAHPRVAEFCENGAKATAWELTSKRASAEFFAGHIPRGCAAGYFPECNPLVPLAHHAEGSKVPASKSIPVRLHVEPDAVHA